MFNVNEEVLQSVLNYLASKPFAEVHELINSLASSQRVDEVEVKEDKWS